MKRCRFLALLLVSWRMGWLPARAQQQITISWPSKQSLGAPTTVDQVTPAHVVVTGVNDLLYHYEGWVTSEPSPLPDIGFAVPKGEAKPCDQIKKTLQDISAAKNNWQLNPFVDENGKKQTTPQSVSFETTRTYYSENVANKFALISSDQAKACSISDEWNKIDQANRDWLNRLAQPHTYTLDITLEPLNDYSIHLREMAYDSTHNLQLTSACTSGGSPTDCVIKFTIKNDLLNVSGGFLFSELQSRTYVRTNVPGSTNAVLGVNGLGSVNSLLTTLVNVKLPCFWGRTSVPPCNKRDADFGWAVSIGPALQLGSSNDVSRVGLFGGLSLHLWKYLYITAGEHVGQFADFPLGFTHVGQDIPAAFTGQLTPATRTSARFAIAVTFRGFSIPTSTAKSQGQTQGKNNTK